MIHWLERNGDFPPVEQALRRPNGLLAAGGDLSPERLLRAYRRGIFPWFSEGEPILWWSPNPRMVLVPGELKIARSLAKTLRKADFEVRADSAFERVIQACAEPRPRQRGTWITAAMQAAYTRLHGLGVAHCVETWRGGELIGGLYGLALGRMFYGESMFSRASDASKIALVYLARQLERWNFGLIDCQMNTPLLASFGAREIARPQFTRRVAELVNYPNVPAPWVLDELTDPPALAPTARLR
ncbi:MAG TPA: leucyl/phenylalanyl-tRNA--protein transferase [Burkholderiales bacterium]|nr:leucyl/phenylalanyl-tRNA--protein transferase [Burkholderiales bacterium]